ncbi:hypothetical protein [Alkalicoccobacillus gibsonii]|uniref:hypothetical protein n=1 Tax=Alkalicoccobacillus gibsonii TaxID=79881 RepID=UPI00193467C7|nr:hypothetical protein [Alkalicoccobacillus gibsonii]MBM0066203.1 hypothetical protein [Alkalicoccobacillus gibsonii]
MNQLIAQLRIFTSELVKGAMIFWTILLAIIIGAYLIAFLGGVPNMLVVTNVPIVVFVAITAFRLIKDDLDYSIHLGITRNLFSFASILYIVAVSILFNLFHQFIILISSLLQGSILKDTLTFFSWSNILSNDSGYVFNFGLDLLLTVLVGFLLFFMASLLTRFGQLAVYIFLLAIILALFSPSVHQTLFDVILAFYQGSDPFLIWGMISAIILLPLLSFFTLQKASA